MCKAFDLPLGHSPHSQGCSRLSLSELLLSILPSWPHPGTCFQFQNVVLSCDYVSFIPLIPELGPLLVLDLGLTEYLENLQHPGHLGRQGQADHMCACRELAQTLCGTPAGEG